MKSRVSASLLTATLLLATTALADEPPAGGAEAAASQPAMTPEQQAEMEAYMRAATPGPQHARLAATAGAYDLTLLSWQDPAAPPDKSTGKATRTMILGGRVMAEDVEATLMGMPFTGHGLFGYDNVTGRYWSTWNDTMGTGIMVNDGTCDDKDNCELTGSWNDPLTKKPVTARMTTRWTSPTVQVFEMHGKGKDGKEMKMMEITYVKR